ncbi:hypothetical protein Tsubulata_010103 [Turnera subulata]|uniref:Uncharacterized protein n=1 Tax=Turnera subulata TaxID=218843 RepID=A0A9Q0J8W0_9ROSI|nr:hypothetical protein Tsubulata_010103 [Turnera subulata]
MSGSKPAGGGQNSQAPIPPTPPDVTMALKGTRPATLTSTPTIPLDTFNRPTITPPQSKSFKESLLQGNQVITPATTSDFEEQEGDIVSFITLEGPVVKISDQYRAMLHKRSLLQVVCNELGRLVRLDHNTKETLRGRYARIAVEIDLSKPLQSQTGEQMLKNSPTTSAPAASGDQPAAHSAQSLDISFYKKSLRDSEPLEAPISKAHDLTIEDSPPDMNEVRGDHSPLPTAHKSQDPAIMGDPTPSALPLETQLGNVWIEASPMPNGDSNFSIPLFTTLSVPSQITLLSLLA